MKWFILPVSIVLSIVFVHVVSDCKVLSNWKPRFGSQFTSCDGQKPDGLVWKKVSQ